jgi:hypothetical protein
VSENNSLSYDVEMEGHSYRIPFAAFSTAGFDRDKQRKQFMSSLRINFMIDPETGVPSFPANVKQFEDGTELKTGTFDIVPQDGAYAEVWMKDYKGLACRRFDDGTCSMNGYVTDSIVGIMRFSEIENVAPEEIWHNVVDLLSSTRIEHTEIQEPN